MLETMCGAGHHMRKILMKLRLPCAQLGITIRQFLSAPREQTAALKLLTG